MKNYSYQNTLISKKQLRQLLAWSFTNYDSMQSCSLADELKYLGFRYASQAGISISIEDLKVPFVKNLMFQKANQEIINAEKIYFKGKITEVERFQKIIDTWSLTSESLKDQIVYYFKNYDPLNSVYIMAFSGARGNLSQVRQLVGMRGLMSDPNGKIMNLPIKKNFREGLTITDYLMSGYGARKGIVDTALKTANSGYLTRRLIDVSHDILIRDKDCSTTHSLLFSVSTTQLEKNAFIDNKLLGRVLNKSVYDSQTKVLLAKINTQLTPKILKELKKRKVTKFYVRSPLTCCLYRAICQKCYGWNLANENLIDVGEAVGILAGQSIGEPGTQLTMRTFHTGGIFTSEARQQIISPCNGIIQFYKFLKTVILRTNRGEEVLVTKNSGFLTLIPDDPNSNLVQIEISKNTILFSKNNQYLLKNTVIGELINTNKQIKTEVKPLLSNVSGEIFVPKLKQKAKSVTNNKLIWLLYGQFYDSPLNSFLNFHADYKLNAQSYIFRTKLINHFNGFVESLNSRKGLYQRLVRITNNKCHLLKAQLLKLESTSELGTHLLYLKNLKYMVRIQENHSKNYLQRTKSETFGTLIKNSYKTLTGGTLYYDHENLFKTKHDNNESIKVRSLNRIFKNEIWWEPESKSLVYFRTFIWLSEEIHKVDCKQNALVVDHGDFISEGFELIPDVFSKTSGFVEVHQKNDIVKIISIKPGFMYEGSQFKTVAKKLYYPGEIILSNVRVQNLSFCEHIVEKKIDQLLVRPIKIYEFPKSKQEKFTSGSNFKNSEIFDFDSKAFHLYKSNQTIKSMKSLDLISSILVFNTSRLLNSNLMIELENNPKNFSLNLKILEKLRLNNYIPSHLKYKNVQSCLLFQKNQFIGKYTSLGYLEAITKDSLEIVKLKIRKQESKQILLISNYDCTTIRKIELQKKKLNDFVLTSSNIDQTGQIIIKNHAFFTIQKGRPYFFPNCKRESLTLKTNLEYKFVSPKRIRYGLETKRNIFLNYHDISRLSLKKRFRSKEVLNGKMELKSEFSKLFLKNNGKFYSCLLPQFFKGFTITNKISKLKCEKLLQSKRKGFVEKKKKIERTLLFQQSELVRNKFRTINEFNSQMTLVKFVEQPFSNAKKSLNLHSITEDYFEKEVNSVFCKNNEFIETGKTIGLLNLENEITGDIVQGLPRIEEILEARKKNLITKKIPISKKKGLLIQKPSLDLNLEFKKLGTTINENDKINPHRLLKVYFNYYGLIKIFLCQRNQQTTYTRLTDNYEGSYKSFKKVQTFILNSVQSVYESQGVTINDKHLEIIIKQMTTKVIITYEGETPLLQREVIDLYHIQYINEIMHSQIKQNAYYVPFLLGITKASLNNPSFISAASFQETTKVLTKAAIEGRVDWLRGLKENIITGHLIPAGTGFPNYRNFFKASSNFKSNTKISINDSNKIVPKDRQVF